MRRGIPQALPHWAFAQNAQWGKPWPIFPCGHHYCLSKRLAATRRFYRRSGAGAIACVPDSGNCGDPALFPGALALFFALFAPFVVDKQ